MYLIFTLYQLSKLKTSEIGIDFRTAAKVDSDSELP